MLRFRFISIVCFVFIAPLLVFAQEEAAVGGSATVVKADFSALSTELIETEEQILLRLDLPNEGLLAAPPEVRIELDEYLEAREATVSAGEIDIREEGRNVYWFPGEIAYGESVQAEVTVAKLQPWYAIGWDQLIDVTVSSPLALPVRHHYENGEFADWSDLLLYDAIPEMEEDVLAEISGFFLTEINSISIWWSNTSIENRLLHLIIGVLGIVLAILALLLLLRQRRARIIIITKTPSDFTHLYGVAVPEGKKEWRLDVELMSQRAEEAIISIQWPDELVIDHYDLDYGRLNQAERMGEWQLKSMPLNRLIKGHIYLSESKRLHGRERITLEWR